MKQLVSNSVLKLILSTALIVFIQSVQAQDALPAIVEKKIKNKVITDTKIANKPLPLVLLSDNLINDYKIQIVQYLKADKATQNEIIPSIGSLFYLESVPQDEETYSFCDIAAQQYGELRQDKSKELDPEITNMICQLIMDSPELPVEMVKPYYLDSGNDDNLNRKISRVIRTTIVSVIDQILAQATEKQ